MLKFKNYTGQSLKGDWLFTYKIDGWQAKQYETDTGLEVKTLSKGGKPLYHLPDIMPKFDIAEIFCGSWNETQSILSASKSKRRQVKLDEIYPLFPDIDKRLVIGTFRDPSAKLINIAFNQAINMEYEGLVLRKGNEFIKVKPTYSEDVPITGFVQGNGKLKGMLGKFTTDSGDVGTGFTELQRKALWRIRKKLIGIMIEVESMEKLPNGKLRHPRFIRLRLDKND